MRSKQFPHQPGQIVDFDSKFWLPVIAIATGMRREEIAQLRRRDIDTVNGVDCICVRAGEGQAIKSPAAERNIPIADTLKKLGFMAFIEDQKLGPDDLILPGCSPMGSMGRYGEVTGKWFGRYLRHIGIKDVKLVPRQRP
jgi:integrase